MTPAWRVDEGTEPVQGTTADPVLAVARRPERNLEPAPAGQARAPPGGVRARLNASLADARRALPRARRFSGFGKNPDKCL
jgi:hypothetical protein